MYAREKSTKSPKLEQMHCWGRGLGDMVYVTLLATFIRILFRGLLEQIAFVNLLCLGVSVG